MPRTNLSMSLGCWVDPTSQHNLGHQFKFLFSPEIYLDCQKRNNFDAFCSFIVYGMIGKQDGSNEDTVIIYLNQYLDVRLDYCPNFEAYLAQTSFLNKLIIFDIITLKTVETAVDIFSWRDTKWTSVPHERRLGMPCDIGCKLLG